MDLEAASSGNMSKNKKASKSAFYDPVGSFFLQKKKVVLENVKHSGNEKDIFLNKFGHSVNVFFNVDSLLNDEKDANMTSINVGSFLDLAANAFKAKCINIGAVFGSSLGLPNFVMNDNEEFFALNINLSAVKKKLVTVKTQFIRKFFSSVNGFERATTPLKFEEIIQSTFTLEKSMKKATLLARKRSNQAVVIKKILMNTPKNMIIATSFLIGKDSVPIAKAVEDHEIWASRDQFRVLLFTLSIETTTHNLRTFLKRAGGKTCVINRSIETGNRIYYAVVDFDSEEKLDAAFHMKFIFGRHFEHLALKCDMSDVSKKNVLISCSAAFGGKFWAQIVSIAGSGSSSNPHFGSDSSFFLSGASGLGGGFSSISAINSFLIAYLASLKCFLKLLTDQVSGFVCKLVGMELVPLVSILSPYSLDVSLAANGNTDSNMVLDGPRLVLSSLSAVLSGTLTLGSSSSKILTAKMGCLKSKLVAFKTFVSSVFTKLEQISAGLGFLASFSSQ
ncbi:hypothetical protein G9A89_002791 [Geosiphon pyriformis]|nr:hypothetical protein G9A89_002791 [Geosiphon pyriformis]